MKKTFLKLGIIITVSLSYSLYVLNNPTDLNKENIIKIAENIHMSILSLCSGHKVKEAEKYLLTFTQVRKRFSRKLEKCGLSDDIDRIIRSLTFKVQALKESLALIKESDVAIQNITKKFAVLRSYPFEKGCTLMESGKEEYTLFSGVLTSFEEDRIIDQWEKALEKKERRK